MGGAGLTIVWVFVVAFVVTFVVTILGMIRHKEEWIPLWALRSLFGALVLEIVGTVVVVAKMQMSEVEFPPLLRKSYLVDSRSRPVPRPTDSEGDPASLNATVAGRSVEIPVKFFDGDDLKDLKDRPRGYHVGDNERVYILAELDAPEPVYLGRLDAAGELCQDLGLDQLPLDQLPSEELSADELYALGDYYAQCVGECDKPILKRREWTKAKSFLFDYLETLDRQGKESQLQEAAAKNLYRIATEHSFKDCSEVESLAAWTLRFGSSEYHKRKETADLYLRASWNSALLGILEKTAQKAALAQYRKAALAAERYRKAAQAAERDRKAAVAAGSTVSLPGLDEVEKLIKQLEGLLGVQAESVAEASFSCP